MVGIFDGVNIKKYVDNEPYGTDTPQSGVLKKGTQPIVFGNTFYGTDRYLNGNMHDIGIWNRALSPQEISQLYNEGRGLSYPFIKPNLFKRISKYIGSATSSFNPAFARRRLLLRK